MTKPANTFAVVGYGYWGPNIVRNLHAIPDATVKWVCDLDSGRHAAVEKAFPTVKATSDLQSVLSDPDVDAIVVCTPVRAHHAVAVAALEAGKHVFVEKPLARTERECREIIELARAKGRKLAVGHTFIYSGAVRKLKDLLDEGVVGRPLYLDSVRTNLGPYRGDVNALWDLATHDIAIFDYLTNGALPTSVSATGKAVLGDVEDFAYVSLRYPGGLPAHIPGNGFAPVKTREMLVVGDKKMVVYDANEATEKIRIYDKGGEATPAGLNGERQVRFRSNGAVIPKLDGTEPLFAELADFNAAILTNAEPKSDGESGLRIVKVLEAASRSLAAAGEAVTIEPEALARAAS